MFVFYIPVLHRTFLLSYVNLEFRAPKNSKTKWRSCTQFGNDIVVWVSETNNVLETFLLTVDDAEWWSSHRHTNTQTQIGSNFIFQWLCDEDASSQLNNPDGNVKINKKKTFYIFFILFEWNFFPWQTCNTFLGFAYNIEVRHRVLFSFSFSCSNILAGGFHISHLPDNNIVFHFLRPDKILFGITLT